MLKRTLICFLLLIAMLFNTGCENTVGLNRMILGTIFVGGGIGALVAKEGSNNIPIYVPGISTGNTYEAGAYIPISTTPTNELEVVQLNGPFNYLDKKNSNKPYTAFYGLFRNKKSEDVIKVIYRIRYFNEKGSEIIDDAYFQEITLRTGQTTPFRILFPRDDRIRYAQIYEYVAIVTGDSPDENTFMFTQVQKKLENNQNKLEGLITALNATTPLIIIGAFYDQKGNIVEVNFLDETAVTFNKSTIPELGDGDKSASFEFQVGTIFYDYSLSTSYKSDQTTVLTQKLTFTKPSGTETTIVNQPYTIQFVASDDVVGQTFSLYADTNQTFDGNEIIIKTNLVAGTDLSQQWTPTATGTYYLMGLIAGEANYSLGSLNVVTSEVQ